LTPSEATPCDNINRRNHQAPWHQIFERSILSVQLSISTQSSEPTTYMFICFHITVDSRKKSDNEFWVRKYNSHRKIQQIKKKFKFHLVDSFIL
jgi:hypothetical protein